MERPNFDFNFDLDCTADHQKEMEEMSKKAERHRGVVLYSVVWA